MSLASDSTSNKIGYDDPEMRSIIILDIKGLRWKKLVIASKLRKTPMLLIRGVISIYIMPDESKKVTECHHSVTILGDFSNNRINNNG